MQLLNSSIKWIVKSSNSQVYILLSNSLISLQYYSNSIWLHIYFIFIMTICIILLHYLPKNELNTILCPVKNILNFYLPKLKIFS